MSTTLQKRCKVKHFFFALLIHKKIYLIKISPIFVGKFKTQFMDKLELSRSIARNLLQIKAIRFNFQDLFLWASGLKSPIYCDNRLSLSYSSVRSLIRDGYVDMIRTEFPDVELIAGVATGAIAQGALVADQLNLPFVYVREKAKNHGLMKLIEGVFQPGQKTVIVEDLVSTGGSSLRVAHELRKAEVQVLGMTAIFSYELPEASDRFKENHCKLHTLLTFSTLIDVALEEGYITKEEADMLDKWHQAPIKLDS
jgi:orotate phosphoribosyltransferase